MLVACCLCVSSGPGCRNDRNGNDIAHWKWQPKGTKLLTTIPQRFVSLGAAATTASQERRLSWDERAFDGFCAGGYKRGRWFLRGTATRCWGIEFHHNFCFYSFRFRSIPEILIRKWLFSPFSLLSGFCWCDRLVCVCAVTAKNETKVSAAETLATCETDAKCMRQTHGRSRRSVFRCFAVDLMRLCHLQRILNGSAMERSMTWTTATRTSNATCFACSSNWRSSRRLWRWRSSTGSRTTSSMWCSTWRSNVRMSMAKPNVISPTIWTNAGSEPTPWWGIHHRHRLRSCRFARQQSFNHRKKQFWLSFQHYFLFWFHQRRVKMRCALFNFNKTKKKKWFELNESWIEWIKWPSKHASDCQLPSIDRSPLRNSASSWNGAIDIHLHSVDRGQPLGPAMQWRNPSRSRKKTKIKSKLRLECICGHSTRRIRTKPTPHTFSLI